MYNHKLKIGRLLVVCESHRVPGFLSSCPNWVPPPLIRKRVLPLPFESKGVGDPMPTMGQKLPYSKYTIIPLRQSVFLAWNLPEPNSVPEQTSIPEPNSVSEPNSIP